MSTNERYIINISFKGETKNICEKVKTMKEAESYKSLIDDTVNKACLIDNASKKIIQWWKK